MGLPRRAVAVQQMSRRSSPSRYSRRLSKSRPSPRCCALAQLQVDLAAAGEKDLLLLAGAQGGIDAHRLRERRAGPALGQSKRRAVAHVEPAGLPVAALLGSHAVAEAGGHAREGSEPMRGRLGDERRRQIVHQAALDDHLAVILDGQLDLGFASRGRERWTRSGLRSVARRAAGAGHRAARPAAPAHPRPAWRRPAGHPRSREPATGTQR